MSKIKAPRDYSCSDEYIVETTHGYYTDDGYGPCSYHDNLDDAVNSCNYWTEKGDICRVVHKGFIVYIPANTDKVPLLEQYLLFKQ